MRRAASTTMTANRAYFNYIRNKDAKLQTVQVRMEGFSQAEMVDLILGLWASLNARDRADIIELMTSFRLAPLADADFPPIALTIASGLGKRVQRLS